MDLAGGKEYLVKTLHDEQLLIKGKRCATPRCAGCSATGSCGS